MDMRGVLTAIGEVSQRPRYAFLVLNLIAQGADNAGACGPFMPHNGEVLTVRHWLLDMLHPILGRASRRAGPSDTEPSLLEPSPAAREADAERSQRSGLSNISRAVSDLVRAGLITRYYAGYRVDHAHRGGQRHAVYVVPAEVRAALAGSPAEMRSAA